MPNNGSKLALLLLLGTSMYGTFQARTLLTGPTLSVTSPVAGAHVPESVFEVHGNIKNASRVFVNGKEVIMETNGNFSERLATPVGYGSVVVEAKNRFGQRIEKHVEFVGNPIH